MKNLTKCLAAAVFAALLSPDGRLNAQEPDHGDEGSAAVGPDKGITAKGPLGFRLSPEAQAKFAYQTAPYTPGTVPCSALVSVKDGKYVFRVREGWIKKVHVDIASRANGQCGLRADDLQSGDQIVTSRMGFLRIAEVILEEGASHSH